VWCKQYLVCLENNFLLNQGVIMLKSIYISLLSVVLTAFASPAHAQIEPTLAESLMLKSGLWKQLDSLSKQLSDGFDSTPPPAAAQDAATKQTVIQAAQLSFGVQRLRERTRDNLLSLVNKDAADPVIAWFDSDLGKIMSRAEEDASAKNPQAHLTEGATLHAAATAERKQLIDQLLVATNATEYVYNVTVNMTTAMILGANKVTPDAAGPKAEDIKNMFKDRKPAMLKQFVALYTNAFAATYVDVSDTQLAAYLAHLTSPSGQAFSNATLTAVEGALASAGGEFGQLMAGAAAVTAQPSVP
jgi:hypothetical protein